VLEPPFQSNSNFPNLLICHVQVEVKIVAFSDELNVTFEIRLAEAGPVTEGGGSETCHVTEPRAIETRIIS